MYWRDKICESSSIYISSGNTSITCDGRYFPCQELTVYTDYTNYPLSYTELFCSGSFVACSKVYVKDQTTGSTSYTNADQFKIFCIDTFMDAYLNCSYHLINIHYYFQLL